MLHEPISIGIADDHKAVRQAIKFFLSQENDFQFVIEAETGAELINKLSRSQPEILLLDIKMPGRNGIEVLKIVSELYPEIKILILSAFADDVCIAQCLHYGIYGYLTKSLDINEIVKAIHKVHNNEIYVTTVLSDQVFKQYLKANQKRTGNCLPEFGEDEIKILNLLKEERTTGEISSIMNLSKRSIEMKRDKMREKANVKTIGGLILYALKRGMIEIN